MARSVISVAKATTFNGDNIATVAALTAGATGADGYVVTAQTQDESFGLLVTNSGSATGVLTLKASDAMINYGQGDLSFVIGGSVTKLVGPLEGARFRQANGDINIDSGITGSCQAFQL